MEKESFYDRLFKVCICNMDFSQTRVFLHLKNKHPPLLWQQRSRILKDVCRGMAWLHATVPPIIHGDIKMFIIAGMCIYACVYHHRTNVLLDRHLTAKLGDFGFSQEFAQVVGGDHSLQLLWWPNRWVTVLLKWTLARFHLKVMFIHMAW